MSINEVFDILNDKETWDVYYKIKSLENDINVLKDLYCNFDKLEDMLKDKKSYINSRAFRFICRLSKYDSKDKINKIIDTLLMVLDDDKPSIVRMCLKDVSLLIESKPELKNVIVSKIKNIDYAKFKDTMSPLIKNDIDKIIKE